MSSALTKQNGDMTVAENQTSPVTRMEEAPRAWASTPVDILEGDDAYLVIADVPGVKKDIHVEYLEGELRLRARREVEHESWASDYRRTFRVGRNVDVDEITAKLEHGVLRVHLPKKASAKPRQIQVQGP